MQNDEIRKPRKKFAVMLSSGAKDPGKIKSALMFATIAQCSGCDAVVYCVQDGADAVIRGKVWDESGLPPGSPTIEQRIQEALQVGVTFELCQQVAKNRNLTEEDLIEGTRIVGGIRLITYALEYDGVLSF